MIASRRIILDIVYFLICFRSRIFEIFTFGVFIWSFIHSLSCRIGFFLDVMKYLSMGWYQPNVMQYLSRGWYQYVRSKVLNPGDLIVFGVENPVTDLILRIHRVKFVS